MPCWEVRLVSVEFKAQSKELLLTALKNLNLQYTEKNGVININYGDIVIDLANSKVTYEDDRQSLVKAVNRIKVAYSTEVVKAIALKKNWVLKQNAENAKQFQARRY